MAQLKELLEKEELEYIEEVKDELTNGTSSNEKSGKGNQVWVWVAALIVAVIILK